MTRYPSGPTALTVLDYSNVFPGRIDATDPYAAALRLREIAMTVARAAEASRVLIRMYGGWMKDGNSPSDAASRALYVMAEADPFPFTSELGIVHGQFELATSLLCFPQFELPDTYRVRGSVPRLRLREGGPPSDCVQALDSCPAVLLKRFTQRPNKRCPAPECPVTCQMTFVHAEQKMVDTHMAVDMIHAATAEEYEYLAAVSGDTDMVPPLLQIARSTGGRLALLPGNGALLAGFADVLTHAGVDILEVGVQ